MNPRKYIQIYILYVYIYILTQLFLTKSLKVDFLSSPPYKLKTQGLQDLSDLPKISASSRADFWIPCVEK